MAEKYLVVITGPTGVGKSNLCITLAQHLSAPIVSCDSRQIYREMSIGTAVPTTEELSAAEHHFIQSHSIVDDYSVGRYEQEAISLLDELYTKGDVVLMVGGTGLYIDAVCYGIDDIPTASEEIRDRLRMRAERGELPQMVEELKQRDIVYYNSVDHSNTQRIIRALEVIEESGKPYSSFRTGAPKRRNFKVIKIVVTREREELYDRINRRVDTMMSEGLLDEVRALIPYKDKNSLQTVGYQELFKYFDGDYSLEEAVELIKRNSRRYAKRQLTWFRRDKDIIWLTAEEFKQISENCHSIEEFIKANSLG